MNLKFKWKKATTQYSTGERLYLNRVMVGLYQWHTSIGSLNWQGQITLPSLRTATVESNDESDIKAQIEKVITTWFNEVLKDGE